MKRKEIEDKEQFLNLSDREKVSQTATKEPMLDQLDFPVTTVVP